LSNGVSCYNPYSNTWITYNESSTPTLSNNIIYGIKEDYKSRVYLLTNKGVNRLIPKRGFEENKNEYSIEYFNIEDGLPDNEGQVRSMFVDSEGRIWVGTIKGAAFYNPYTEFNDTVLKKILITNVFIPQDKTKDILKSGISLSHDQNNIVFEFSLLSFYKEKDNRFQVQLVGLDKQPLPWSTDYKKEYTNLTSGDYIFKIWGKDYAANISGPLEFNFTILPPFWLSWWFGALTALLVSYLIYISIKRYIYYKVKKRLAYLERAQLLERERTRISQDMHDSIGSNLTRIVVLSELLNDDLSKESSKSMVSLLSKKVLAVGEMAREIIDTMNEIIWSINPIYDNLENLVNYMTKLANEILDEKKINSKLNISEKIPNVSITPEFRRNLYLIFKEALNNIIKHSEANEVEINILVEANNFIFSIEDNGVGFTENFKNSSMKLHMGIENMKKRASLLDGELKIEAIPGSGTRINFCQTKLDKYII
jgi:signal transduction histidine kinase